MQLSSTCQNIIISSKYTLIALLGMFRNIGPPVHSESSSQHQTQKSIIFSFTYLQVQYQQVKNDVSVLNDVELTTQVSPSLNRSSEAHGTSNSRPPKTHL